MYWPSGPEYLSILIKTHGLRHKTATPPRFFEAGETCATCQPMRWHKLAIPGKAMSVMLVSCKANTKTSSSMALDSSSCPFACQDLTFCDQILRRCFCCEASDPGPGWEASPTLTALRPRQLGAVPLTCLDKDERLLGRILTASGFCLEDCFFRPGCKTGGLQLFQISFRLAKLGIGPLVSLQGWWGKSPAVTQIPHLLHLYKALVQTFPVALAVYWRQWSGSGPMSCAPFHFFFWKRAYFSFHLRAKPWLALSSLDGFSKRPPLANGVGAVPCAFLRCWTRALYGSFFLCLKIWKSHNEQVHHGTCRFEAGKTGRPPSPWLAGAWTLLDLEFWAWITSWMRLFFRKFSCFAARKRFRGTLAGLMSWSFLVSKHWTLEGGSREQGDFCLGLERPPTLAKVLLNRSTSGRLSLSPSCKIEITEFEAWLLFLDLVDLSGDGNDKPEYLDRWLRTVFVGRSCCLLMHLLTCQGFLTSMVCFPVIRKCRPEDWPGTWSYTLSLWADPRPDCSLFNAWVFKVAAETGVWTKLRRTLLGPISDKTRSGEGKLRITLLHVRSGEGRIKAFSSDLPELLVGVWRLPWPRRSPRCCTVVGQVQASGTSAFVSCSGLRRAL